MAFFPPKSVYPKNYDSDYTLFVVYNTSETVTTADNSPWADEILIKPVAADKDEIWADNGFANIEGELFYYDTVEKDSITNKVFKLKRCARNLGGTHTKHNLTGAEVRGFVISEHHNQIVGTILNIEKFIGENFSENMSTLDWRIRHLQQLPVIFDDFNCPNISFEFYVIDDNPATGVLAQYNVAVDGTFTSFRLDFGDGEFTTTATNGTHRYATSSIIDPIITVSNSKCTIVQTPITRTIATEPQVTTIETRFEIPIPEIPNIPSFELPTIPTPSTIVQMPPIVFPCLDIGPIGPLNIPSIIEVIPPINIPSIISFSDLPDIPSLIVFGEIPDIPTLIAFESVEFPTLITFGPIPSIPTTITFGPLPDIPTIIAFGVIPNIPTIIAFGIVDIPTEITFGPIPDIPTEITFGPAPYIPTEIKFGPAPYIPTEIKFGPAPYVTSYITFGPTPYIPTTITFGPAPYVTSYVTFGPAPYVTSYVTFGPAPYVPSYITFGPAPSIPQQVTFGPAPTLSVVWGPAPTCSMVVSCPSSGEGSFRAGSNANFADLDPIEVQVGELNIPSEIIVKVPEIPDIRVLHDVPKMIRVEVPVFPDIKIIGPDIPLPKEIKLISDGVLQSIELLATNVPKSIELIAPNVPKTIKLEVPESFPDIKIDASGIPKEIQVTGIPKSIELIGPSEIKLALPDKPLEVEMVYKGAPIDVKINLDIGRLTGEDGNAQCVAIVPCAPK